MALNENQIAATVLSDLIRKSFNSILSGAAGKFSSAWQKIFQDFSPFMEESYRKNSKVRIICQKETDVDFDKIYIKSNFTIGSETCDDDELFRRIQEGKNVIINGNGGAGKTFFMRHLWLEMFKSDTTQTPIFIELRQINEINSSDLKTFIRKTISPNTDLAEDIFMYFCEQGKFCLILDGFDEIQREKRDVIQSQILSLAASNPRCRIVVSSRYENRFSGWSNFDLYESRPFSLQQTRKLISKIPFDEHIKKIFLKRLDESFYKQNKSFLSNPLLSIMMLMTYRENMDIPGKMSIFFDHAFTTLYQWHDATKVYSRKKVLDISDFQKSFGVFCFLSYYKQKYQFSKTEVISFISKSSKICGIDAKPEDILLDYEESVNLLRQEGVNYVFIHRSFQEYFCAYSLMFIFPDKFGELLPQIASRTTDKVLSLCFEMNKSAVVSEYIDVKYKDASKLMIKHERMNARFPFLSMLDVKMIYSFFAIDDEDDDSGAPRERVDTSMAVMGHEEMFEFLENINKIRGSKKTGFFYLEFPRNIIFRHELYDLARDLAAHPEFTPHSAMTIIVSPNSVNATMSFDDNLDESNISEFDSIVRNSISSNIDLFDKIEADLATAVRKTMDWCRKEISDGKKRGKSLDEILGL